MDQIEEEEEEEVLLLLESSVAGAEINWASRRETCRKLLRNDIQRADRAKARALALDRLLDEPFQLDKVGSAVLRNRSE